LIWEKGIREMIEAFQSLKGRYPNIKLWFVGWADQDNPRHVDDTYIKSFEGDDTILFLGRKKDVKELLALSDVFLYPSYYREGIPRGILEALSMGLPVITAYMPGCNLTVEDGKNGYLILPKSADAVKEGTEKLLANRNFTAMGRYSRKMAETRFSEAIIFSQIEKLYSE
jgi:glycosyltransferase involved in cell wall biosynthesis